MKVCPKCGSICEEGAFCDVCGAQLSDDTANVSGTGKNSIEKPSAARYVALGLGVMVVALIAIIVILMIPQNKNDRIQADAQQNANETKEFDGADIGIAEETDAADQEVTPEAVPTVEVTATPTPEATTVPTSTPTPTPTPEPENEYIYVLEDCSWTEACARCIEMGGHLVHFDTPGEAEKVIADFTAKGYGEKSKFWIGGARNSYNDDNQYYWVNANGTVGDAISLSDSHWMTGEPSYIDPGLDNLVEDKMILYNYKNSWVYNDEANDVLKYLPHYSGTIGYICEIEH